MPLVDLKLSPKKNKAQDDQPCCTGEDRSQYPYGTSITIEKPAIDKMDALKDIKAGDVVTGEFVGKVTGVHASDRENDKSTKRVEIQFHKLAVSPEPKKAFSAGFEGK